ncbi:response regulator [Roseomonas sp. KE2513]|uniref:response regulator n=1 Tax=Roseomonas sp. KE2513 TaxID=2479202 RepID=UPI002815210A|nr:response regulator [Roseomonas sp. KE2513]MBI0538523.1 response regulator [Roseomonas sp. KE2513]
MGQAAPPGRPVVLVVEDEPILRMMAVDVVEEAGFEAVEAAGAEDAVAILETRPDIRIVFTDIDMPGGADGMKLAAMIRDRWPPIEIIIISGRRTPRPEDMPARGVFFSKPYKREEIAETIRRLAP